ncbi:hypothetical protein V8E36_002296, partial [Tilletia maclaganii]
MRRYHFSICTLVVAMPRCHFLTITLTVAMRRVPFGGQHSCAIFSGLLISRTIHNTQHYAVTAQHFPQQPYFGSFRSSPLSSPVT